MPKSIDIKRLSVCILATFLAVFLNPAPLYASSAAQSLKVESTANQKSFLAELFKSIFNLFTFNLFSPGDKPNIAPTVTPTSLNITADPVTSFGDLQTTPSVLGEAVNPTINPGELVDVVSVVDGDTIKVKLNNKTETIRLIGIDTPEVVDPRKPVQCFGKEASSKAKELLSKHKVKLESDPTQGDRDKYKRLLRYVFREDGLFFNDWMIRNGYAHEYTYDLPYKYQTQFKEAEKYARENNFGLWSPSVCVTPSPTTKIVPTTTFAPKTEYIPLTQPPIQYSQPTSPPTTNVSNFSCNCSKTCEQMSSCNEAYFQLNQCGCLKRDGDKDGVPCESICPGG